MKEARDAPEAEEIDRIAQRVHVERSDDFTLKWAKQTSKHRNSARGSVHTLIAAMKAVGYAPLTKRRELLALTAERDALLSRVESIGQLREALTRMENCCEQLAATRSIEIYTAMIDGGQAQALLDLDNARRNARAALKETSHD